MSSPTEGMSTRLRETRRCLLAYVPKSIRRAELSTRMNRFLLLANGRGGMYTVCKSGRQLKRRRERFRTETVRREREASIAKSNPKHLARDNQLSLSGGNACHSIKIYFERGASTWRNVGGYCFPRHSS